MASASVQHADDAINRQVNQLDLGGPSSQGAKDNRYAAAHVDEESVFSTTADEALYLNGSGSMAADDDGGQHDATASISVQGLQAELQRVKDERDSFESQYQGLLSKLGQMRSTLGDRLRQDAEELDRREQSIDALNAKVDELSQSIKTLESELVASHQEVERLSKELDGVRNTLQERDSNAAQASSSSAAVSAAAKGSELRLRELQEMAERYRIDAESWESACMEERAYRDEVDLQIHEAKRERDEAIAREREYAAIAAREQDTSRGLQQVLEEFQSAQEAELRRAVGDHEERVEKLSTLLNEHQERTQNAEQLAAAHKEAAERCQVLDKEVKEKNLMIGKLRHEAVILNEHLTESLRRLRANTSDSNVDGKLISNLLIQFLNTPRQDTKRFEMLNLIASVLNWSAEDRERAGLQRNPERTGGKAVGVSATRNGKATGQPGTPGGSASNEESFSNLFVEFLLSEADKAKQSSQTSGSNANTRPSSPATPKQNARPSFNLGSLASLNRKSTDDVRSSVGSPTSNGADASRSPNAVRSP